MKILVTGMNSLQTTPDYYLRQQLQVVPTHYALVAALRDMGHEVDQRPVTIGESLDEYDEAIIFIHNPSGFAGYVYNALWAIHRKPNCILSIDDWQADSIFEGVCQLEDKERLFRKFIIDSHVDIPANLESYGDVFLESVQRVKSMQNRMIVAGFGNGDLTKMLPGYPTEKFMSYNPNPYHLNRTPENGFGEGGFAAMMSEVIKPEDKVKSWVFASLVQAKTRKWLKSLDVGNGWPIEYFGAKGGDFKSTRLKEADMCNEYQKNWGCLAPSYYHAGSGFWRPRALQLADANSILVVDDAEGKIYSEAHVGVRPKDVEQMDLSQLADLAKRQKEGLYDNHPLDKALTRAALNRILDSK